MARVKSSKAQSPARWGDKYEYTAVNFLSMMQNHKCIPDTQAPSTKQITCYPARHPSDQRANSHRKKEKKLDNNQCLLAPMTLSCCPRILACSSSTFLYVTLFHLSMPKCAGGIIQPIDGRPRRKSKPLSKSKENVGSRSVCSVSESRTRPSFSPEHPILASLRREVSRSTKKCLC